MIKLPDIFLITCGVPPTSGVRFQTWDGEFETRRYQARLNSFLSDSKTQLDKIHNCALNFAHFARKLGFIFDEQLTISYPHVEPILLLWCLSTSLYMRPHLDSKTACTIATFIVHSKLIFDYCDFLLYNLPVSLNNSPPTDPRTLSHALLSKLLILRSSPLALNASSCHLHKKTCYNHPTFISA